MLFLNRIFTVVKEKLSFIYCLVNKPHEDKKVDSYFSLIETVVRQIIKDVSNNKNIIMVNFTIGCKYFLKIYRFF